LARRNKSGLEISWTTITYRSVALTILAVGIVVGFVFYLLFPQQTKVATQSLINMALDLAVKMGVAEPSKNRTIAAGPQQAHFTAIDGTVRVKKVSGNTFIAADYNLPLDRADVVQTSGDGIAKIVFADGTSYTVKQDSLIVIDDNSVNSNQQTQVSVQVTTGTVDLATATFSQGSKSQVVVAGATASLSPESAAQVRNDPRADTHEIVVSKGSGEVTRGNETLRLSEFEKVSFKAESAKMAKSKEVGPPTLIGPANMAPIFSNGKVGSVSFTWTPQDRASGYRVRVSRNPYFSSTVLDQRAPQSNLTASLPEGAYYWTVQTIDPEGAQSIESEKNRFTIIPRSQEKVALPLDLAQLQQHGHVIEVRGKTEAGAKVMVNGQEVPSINGDGSFTFLTPPLPTGENVITVTAQNSKGGVNTQQRKIRIE
jgi:Glucodextranase, domain B/FecR protein